MSSINLLSKEIISKIAAGEVVDGPGGIVKELVENALDANATTIKVFIENGGLKEITVVDDGNGMSRADLEVCVERHATSKITTLSDLNNIGTYGFRGEALYSIAAFCNMEISSRSQDQIEGNYIKIIEGNVVEKGLIGMPIGTKVTVKNLFTNFPARQKFLKSISDEMRKVTDTITEFCIANPEVSFKLIHNETTILDLTQDIDYESRIKRILPKSLNDNLVYLNNVLYDYELTGFISKPQAARTGRSKQYFFVNNRSIEDSNISEIVKNTYGNLLDSKKHPPFVLLIKTPLNVVDVNIHPQKKQVKIMDSETINEFIIDSITQTLEENDLTFKKKGYSFVNQELKNHNKFNVSDEVYVRDPSFNKFDISEVLQVHDTYLIAQSNEGVIIFDQHAAHERIIYEELLNIYERSFINEDAIDNFYTPLILELDAADLMVIDNNQKMLEKIGIRLEIKEDSISIYSLPKIYKGRNLSGIIHEFVDDIKQFGYIHKSDTNLKLALSYLACRSAVKAGYSLEKDKALALINDVLRIKGGYTCPHGRPLKVEVPISELNKWFERS
ncbi:DNA mismatch repair endonuclease MutL [Patescibacteria group bacterium]